MKKVLILANSDVGLYKFRKEIIEYMIEKGNSVYISAPQGELMQKFKNYGCNYIKTEIDRRGNNIFRDLKLIYQYDRIIKEIKPDLVVMYTIKPNIYGGLISKKEKIPYYINITGLGSTFQKENMLRSFVIWLYRISINKANTVFFENQENQKIFVENNIVKYKKTKKINGAGVNLEEYKYVDYPKGKKLHFLFIGRIMKEKGINELLEIIVQIQKEFNDIIFDIVGPLEEDYIDKIEKLQKKGNLNYHGIQYDVKPFIKSSCCVILPSYHEGMSNTLLESGSMGRPLITSDIPGCREAVINHQSGFLVEPGNSEDLLKKVREFIQLPWEKKEKMAIASREHIESKFDRKEVVKETIEMFDLS